MRLDTSTALIAALRQYGLLEDGQGAEAEQLAGRLPEAKALARELIQRGWLTPFQVNQLFLGRGNELTLKGFQLLERVGEGGMGQVFKARQINFRRIVALKVIRKERLTHPDAVRRFYREIQAAAKLDHPNVVQAFDADCEGETHFFAMEYVQGKNLTQLVKEKGPLPVLEACSYIRQAALGLQHAHERGLVHRDIKPANLLVTNAGQVVKVLDMGLARPQVESDDGASTLTQEGSVMGTPDYIAPEQARDAHQADIRADLYSLGCTMYYLLTGQVPFPGGTLTEKLLKHQMDEPTPVCLVRPDAPPAVEEVVQVLMAKRPEDRFQTPGQLAAVLGAILESPGQAPSGLSSVRLRRQQSLSAAGGRQSPDSVATAVCPLPAGSAGLPVAIPVAGVAATGVPMAVPVMPADPFAELGQSDTMVASETPMPVVTPAVPLAGPSLMEALSQRLLGPVASKLGLPPTKAWIVGVVGLVFIVLVGLIALLYFSRSTGPREFVDHPGKPPAPMVPGLDALTRSKIPAEELTDWLPDEVVGVVGESRGRHPGGLACLALSPDGQTIASGGTETILLWDMDSRKRLGVLTLPGKAFKALILAKVAKKLFAAADQFIYVWNLAKGFQAGGKPPTSFHGHTGAINALALASNGKTLVSAGQDGIVIVWDVKGAQLTMRAVLNDFASAVLSVALSPDGKTLAAGETNKILLYDMTTAEPTARAVLDGLAGTALPLAFSQDGKLLAAGTGHGLAWVHIWDVAGKPRELEKLPGGGYVTNLFFKGQVLSVAGAFADISRWEIGALKAKKLDNMAFPGTPLAVWNGRDILVCGSNNTTVRVFKLTGAEAREVQPLVGQGGPATSLAFDPAGKMLAVASGPYDQVVRLWNVTGPAPVLATALPLKVSPYAVRFAPDGKALAIAGSGGQVVLFDLERASLPELRTLKGTAGTLVSLAYSADGKWLAAGDNAKIYLWHLEKPKEESAIALAGHASNINGLAFAADGKTLVSAAADGKVIVWDLTVSPPKNKTELTGPGGHYALQLSQDGLLAFTGSVDTVARAWDLAAGKLQDTIFPGHVAAVLGLGLTRDGKTLISADAGGIVKAWDLQSKRAPREWKLDYPLHSLAVAADNRHVAVGTGVSLVYIFRLAAGK